MHGELKAERPVCSLSSGLKAENRFKVALIKKLPSQGQILDGVSETEVTLRWAEVVESAVIAAMSGEVEEKKKETGRQTVFIYSVERRRRVGGEWRGDETQIVQSGSLIPISSVCWFKPQARF